MKNLLVCPNKNLPEWQNLEATLGEDLAWKTFARNNGEYATPLEAVFQEFLQQRSSIAIPLLETYTDPEFKKTITSFVSPLEIIRNANDNIYANDDFKKWLSNQSFSKKLLISDIETTTPKNVSQQLFDKKLKEKLISFLGGLNFTVKFDDQALKDILEFKNDPLSAVDLIQKFVLVAENENFNSLPRSAAYILYSMLGKKNEINKDIWFNIHKWSGYQKLYDFYKNKSKQKGSLDEFIDESFVTYKDLNNLAKNANTKIKDFDFNAHKQVIIEFLTLGITENFGQDVSPNKKRVSKDIDKEYFSQKGFKNPYEESWLLRMWNKLYNFLREKVLGIKKYNDVSEQDLIDIVLDIADDVYKEKYEKWTRGFRKQGDTIIGPDGKILELKNYDDLATVDPRGWEIIQEFVSNDNGVNAKLSGSATTRKFGKTYRPKDETLHDIDFVIQLSRVMKEANYQQLLNVINEGLFNGVFMNRKSSKKYTMKKILPLIQNQSWYKNVERIEPSFVVLNAFIGKDHRDGESITVQGVIDGEFDKHGNHIEKTGYVIDFFIRTKLGNYPEEFENYWKAWKQIFEAKLSMGRGKDLIDLIYYEPYIQDNYKFKNKGHRYFDFADNIVKNDSIPQMLYDDIMSYNKLPEYPESFYTLTDEQKFNQMKANYIAIQWAQSLSSKLGIKYEKVSSDTAIQLLSNTDTPYTNQPSFFYNGIVYLVQDKINLNSVFHEFAHPIIKMIQAKNRSLFESLYQSVINTPEGKVIKTYVKNEYKNLEEESDRFKEEVIVNALAYEATDLATKAGLPKDPYSNLENKEASLSKGFLKAIQNILSEIRMFIRKMFGNKNLEGDKIKAENLEANTTIKDLADIIIGKNFSIEFDEVAKEYVDFKRVQVKEIEDLVADVSNDPKRQALQASINILHQRIEERLAYIKKVESAIKTETKDLLDEESGAALLKQLREQLKPYRTTNVKVEQEQIKQKNIITNNEDLKNAAQAYINTLVSMNLLVKKINTVLETIKDEQIQNQTTDTDTLLNDLRKVNSFKGLYSGFDELLAEANKEFLKNGFSTEKNPIFRYIGEIQDNIKKGDILIKQIDFEKVKNILYEKLAVVKKNIDDKYARELKRFDKIIAENPDKKQYGEKRKAELTAEYKKWEIDKSKLEASLKGETVDLTITNKNFDEILNINDLSIGAFGITLKEAYTKAEIEAEKLQLDFQRSIADLLKELGYSNNNAHNFWKEYMFKDKSFKYEDGELIEQEVWSILNPTKNWRYDKRKKLDDLEELSFKDREQFKIKSKEYYNWDKKYFHQRYKTEVYEKDKIFEEYEHGWDAWLARESILEKLRLEQGSNFNELDIYESTNIIKGYQDELKQLYSLNYPDGTPKVDVPEKNIYDRSIAEVLAKHRESSKKFYEYIDVPGLFQEAFNEFVQSLALEGITPDSADKAKRMEYYARVHGDEGWIAKNTKMAFKESFNQQRLEALNTIKEITSSIDISEKYSYIFDVLSIFKDEYGETDVSRITDATMEKLRLAQEDIINAQDKLAIMTGISIDEMEELIELTELLKRKGKLEGENREKYEELLNRKENPAIGAIKLAQLKGAFKVLASIQFKQATDDYVEQANIHLKLVGGAEVDKTTANKLLEDNEFLESAMKKNKRFKEWFLKTHVKKEFINYKTKKREYKYERIYAYSVTRPTNPADIKSFKIKDPFTDKVIPVVGEPAFRFKYRRIKNDYRTIPIGLTPEQRENYVGVVIDNMGNFLPKSFEDTVINPLTNAEQKVDTAPADSPYVNQEYYDLKNANDSRFELLKKTTEYTLKFQKNATKDAKLYLDLPRFEMDRYEYVASGNAKQEVDNLRKVFSYIPNRLRGEKDQSLIGNEFEQDFGNAQIDELKTEAAIKYADISLEDLSSNRIPVHGVSDALPIEKTSTNLLYSLGKYNISLQYQNQKFKIDPLAQSLMDVLDDPDNAIKNMSRADRIMKEAYGVTRFKKKYKNDQKSRRQEYLQHMIDRELRGKMYDDAYNEHSVMLNKAVSTLNKFSSFQFFGLNIQSAAKNYLGMVWQNTVLGLAGIGQNDEEYDGLAPIALQGGSYVKGQGKALQAMMLWTSYTSPFVNATTIDKPLDVQLIRLMDAHKSFEDKFANDTQRSFLKDVVSMSWLYSPRKFLEMEGALALFYGMLYQQYVEINEGGVTRLIPYAEAWELDESGVIKLKDGISKDWDINGKLFQAFKNRVGAVGNQLNGAFAKLDQPYLQKNFFYRMMAFMRRYFYAPLMARFSKRRYNFGVGSDYEGWYLLGFKSIYKFIMSTIKGEMRSYLQFMGKEERIALTRIAADALIMMLFNLALYFFFGWDDDDDEAYKKIKEKYEAGEVSWLGLQFLKLGLNVRNENQAFINPLDPTDLKVVNHYLSFVNPQAIALSGPLTNTVSILFKDLPGWIAGRKYAFYQQDVGPWGYQKEGSPKIWNDIFKGYLGLSGSDIDPLMDIEKIFKRQYTVYK